MGPGGGLVVGGSGLEEAVQDADEAVAELAERAEVSDAAGAEFVVVASIPTPTRAMSTNTSPGSPAIAATGEGVCRSAETSDV
jgi:hypothetical protein